MKTLLTLLLITSAVLLKAQNIDIEWSEKDKKIQLSSEVAAAIPVDNRVYVITNESKKVTYI